MKRSSRAGVEDRWHRNPKPGEQVPYPADHLVLARWCTDPKARQPGTLVTSARHGQGRRWLARWVDHDGQERTQAFARKAEAQQHIADVTTSLTTRELRRPRRGAVTFATVAEPWFDSKSGLKPKTRAGYRSLLDVVVLPRWTRRRSETSPTPTFRHGSTRWPPTPRHDSERHQKRSADATRRGLSAARVIQAYQVLDQVLRYAVRARYISVNPADDVAAPPEEQPGEDDLTHDQVRQLADAAGELRTMVYVLGYGGLRYGELPHCGWAMWTSADAD